MYLILNAFMRLHGLHASIYKRCLYSTVFLIICLLVYQNKNNNSFTEIFFIKKFHTLGLL